MKHKYRPLAQRTAGLALTAVSLGVLYIAFTDRALRIEHPSAVALMRGTRGAGEAVDDESGADGTVAARAVLPDCVVNTCSDVWSATDGAHDANQDNAGCAVVRTMARMGGIKANVTGAWCKAWRAVRMCEQQRYRYFIFREDDTRIDVLRLLQPARRSRAPVIASYKSPARRRVITNWFLLDTTSKQACAKMREWWGSARWDHPQHGQKYFNRVLTCGRNGLLCINKRDGLLNEVHCPSSLGSWKSRRRQACLRYQTQMDQSLL